MLVDSWSHHATVPDASVNENPYANAKQQHDRDGDQEETSELIVFLDGAPDEIAK
jgi:hypothetical protein